jgi:peroxidase
MALDVIIVRWLLLVAAVASVLVAPARAGAGAGLAIGFYNETCPNAEELVLEEMRAIVHKDKSLGPALLRLLFHDCFVRVRSCFFSILSCAYGLVARWLRCETRRCFA